MPLFFGSRDKDYNKSLLTLASFETRYKLTLEIKTAKDTESRPMATKIISTFHFNQQVREKEIINTITLKEINGETDSNQLKGYVQQLILLAKLSPTFMIGRNKTGEITDVRNRGQLIKDWNSKQEALLAEVFKDERQRRAFYESYEKGFESLDLVAKENIQYQLMLPELYHFNHYYDPFHPSRSNHIYKHRSHHEMGMFVKYRLSSTGFNDKATHVCLSAESKLENKEELDLRLSKSTNTSPGISKTAYGFKINTYYELEKQSGKIITGTLVLKEFLNDADYKMKLVLEEIKAAQEEIKENKNQEEKTLYNRPAATIKKSGWTVFDGLDEK